MKKVVTENAPAPVGPYNQAIIANGFIFTAGQIAIDPATNEVMLDASISDQTEQVLKNLEAVLLAANSSFERVIKTTVFLQSMDDFTDMNEVYANYFKGITPARSAVEVAGLPKGVKVEIECIALQ